MATSWDNGLAHGDPAKQTGMPSCKADPRDSFGLSSSYSASSDGAPHAQTPPQGADVNLCDPADPASNVAHVPEASAVPPLPMPMHPPAVPVRFASRGSVGHPEFCRRACVYFRTNGVCAQGRACDYCHLHHSGGSMKLERPERQALSIMSDGQLLVALRRALSRKVGARGQAVYLQPWRDLIEFCEHELEQILAVQAITDDMARAFSRGSTGALLSMTLSRLSQGLRTRLEVVVQDVYRQLEQAG